MNLEEKKRKGETNIFHHLVLLGLPLVFDLSGMLTTVYNLDEKIKNSKT